MQNSQQRIPLPGEERKGDAIGDLRGNVAGLWTVGVTPRVIQQRAFQLSGGDERCQCAVFGALLWRAPPTAKRTGQRCNQRRSAYRVPAVAEDVGIPTRVVHGASSGGRKTGRRIRPLSSFGREVSAKRRLLYR